MTHKQFFQLATDAANALERFLLVLDSIPFAVIGGFAVNAYAKEALPTADIDVCIAEVNMPSVLKRAKEAGFKVKKHNRTINLTYSGSDLKIQLQRDPEYQKLADKGVLKTVMGYRLKVAPKQDVIAGKKKAMADIKRSEVKRKKDELDLLRLQEV